MPYVVTQRCLGTKDRACVEVCPVDCFYDVRRLELNEKYGVGPANHNDAQVGMLMIHPDECIDCGACETACPVEAIYESDVVPDEHESFVELNAQVTRGLSAAERGSIRCWPTYKKNGSRVAH